MATRMNRRYCATCGEREADPCACGADCWAGLHRYGPRLHRWRPEGGRGASVRAAATLTYYASADAIYTVAASRLGLYGVAFFGDAGSAQDRRRLRDAWREAMAIAHARGNLPPSFDGSAPAYPDAAVRALVAAGGPA
jgi:hypothetical protein